jgi:WD40 repeat protein
VSKDTTLQFWDFTTLTRVANRAGYGQAIPCLKEIKPNVIAFGDLYSSNTHTIYFWDVSDVLSGATILAQVSYTNGPAQTCFDMKMYGTNNLVIANNNQQTVDMWNVNSYAHSTLNVGPNGASKDILCIEPISKLMFKFILNTPNKFKKIIFFLTNCYNTL